MEQSTAIILASLISSTIPGTIIGIFGYLNGRRLAKVEAQSKATHDLVNSGLTKLIEAKDGAEGV